MIVDCLVNCYLRLLGTGRLAHLPGHVLADLALGVLAALPGKVVAVCSGAGE